MDENTAICIVIAVAIVVVLIVSLTLLTPRRVFIVSLNYRKDNLPFTLPTFGVDSRPGMSDSGSFYYVGNNFANTGKKGNSLSCDKGKWGQRCELTVYPEGLVHDVSDFQGCVEEMFSSTSDTCFERLLGEDRYQAATYSDGVCTIFSDIELTGVKEYNPFSTAGVYMKSDVIPTTGIAYAYPAGTLRYWLDRGDVLRLFPGVRYQLPPTYTTVTNASDSMLVLSNATGQKFELGRETITLPKGYINASFK